MVAADDIILFADRVAEQFHPERIVVFGSYAYGRPTADSDVDFLVVMPYRGHSHRMAGADPHRDWLAVSDGPAGSVAERNRKAGAGK